MDWWKQQLQRDIEPGFFGENLTITHWWPTVRVGDILHAGELKMEITGPRVPCAVLAARVGNPAFVRQFVRAARCGAYARVLQPGSLSPGDRLHITPANGAYPTVEEIFRCWHSKTQDADFLRRVLAALEEQETELRLGRNEPYAVDMENDYSIPLHAEARKLPYVEFEMRQDLLEGPDAPEVWADRLEKALRQAADNFLAGEG